MPFSSFALAVALALVAATLQGCTPFWCPMIPLLCGHDNFCNTGYRKRFSWKKDDTDKCSAACEKKKGCIGIAFCSHENAECKGGSKANICYHFEDCKDAKHVKNAQIDSGFYNMKGFEVSALYTDEMRAVWSGDSKPSLFLVGGVALMVGGAAVAVVGRVWRRRSGAVSVQERSPAFLDNDAENVESLE